MDKYDFNISNQIDRSHTNFIQDDLTDTLEIEIPPSFSQKRKNLTFVENDVENGIIVLNTTSCCFYKHSHNMPHDHFAISRGIQCGNGLNNVCNPLKLNPDNPNIQQNQPKSAYRYFQYPRNISVNQDFNKTTTITEYPVQRKWDNSLACPSLRESEKFRKSQDESIVNRSFTIEEDPLLQTTNGKQNVLKSIMKSTSKDDYNNDCEFMSSIQSNGNLQHNPLCSNIEEALLGNYSYETKTEMNKVSEDLNQCLTSLSLDNNNNFSDFGLTISTEIPDLCDRNYMNKDNSNVKNLSIIETIENKSENSEEIQQNLSIYENENVKINPISIKNDRVELEKEKAIMTNKSPILTNRKSRTGFCDLNNSNFHNEPFQKFKHTSYFTESVNSRNIVRAKYCSEKSVKHKFFLSENANIEMILQDPSDRRIKAVCDKFNCDIDVYSKVIKSGYLKNIVVISAPNYDCLRKCVRSLDSNMSWCLTCQLNS